MQSADRFMTAMEKTVWQLRDLYEGLGYAQYPMRRFEEYELYQQNKAFLAGESVLAFPSPDGRMLALKPDVTLSIVKHTRATQTTIEKLYYNESVFRAEKPGSEFREIGQMGIEYLGDIDDHAMLETVALAKRSLGLISQDNVLELSHMGFAGALLELAGLTCEQGERALAFIRQKNVHELKAEFSRLSVCGAAADALALLPTLCGAWRETVQSARAICLREDMTSALDEIARLCERMDALGLGGGLMIDFSSVDDGDYYTGLVMRGYVRRAPRAVLSGGRYDALMQRLGKAAGGVGFAVYLDELKRLLTDEDLCDIDTLVLYDESADPALLQKALFALEREGGRVFAAKAPPMGKRIGRTITFADGALLEANPYA